MKREKHRGRLLRSWSQCWIEKGKTYIVWRGSLEAIWDWDIVLLGLQSDSGWVWKLFAFWLFSFPKVCQSTFWRQFRQKLACLKQQNSKARSAGPYGDVPRGPVQNSQYNQRSTRRQWFQLARLGSNVKINHSTESCVLIIVRRAKLSIVGSGWDDWSRINTTCHTMPDVVSWMSSRLFGRGILGVSCWGGRTLDVVLWLVIKHGEL